MKLIEQALKGPKTALVSLANIVVHNHLALCYFLAVQGRVFLVTNTSCCAWINATGQVDVNIKEIPMQKGFTTLARAIQSHCLVNSYRSPTPKVNLVPSISRPLSSYYCSFWRLSG